jgi:hypothetical protein
MSDRREPDEKINNELGNDVDYDWGITHTNDYLLCTKYILVRLDR